VDFGFTTKNEAYGGQERDPVDQDIIEEEFVIARALELG
jgi:hypothetical protein